MAAAMHDGETKPLTRRPPAVLVIPGLNGHPGLLMESSQLLFPSWRALPFSHHLDLAEDGVDGLAARALDHIASEDEPVYVCGESFGGTVALRIAYLNPERVRGLILLSTFGWYPSVLARRGAGALAVWSFLGGRVGNTVYRAARVASLPSQLGLQFSSALFQSYISRPRANIGAYRTKAELSLTFDARPWLGRVEAPAFILTGTWDPVVPISAGRALANALPHAKLHSLPGGHLVHLVHARRTGSLIETWAREIHSG
jgi:pimeloyl-ACP methyl ester carboxylesterase